MKTIKNFLRKTACLWVGVLLGASVAAQAQNPGLERAAAVKAARVGQLLNIQGVVGAGVGLDDAGQGAVHIMVVDGAAAARSPRVLDGVPVVVQVTGKILALGAMPAVVSDDKSSGKGGGKPGGTTIDPTGYFTRPVPIGVSTGNAKIGTSCSAGTIGCRVKANNKLYALSNNHVYARENEAFPGEPVTQPGPYDTRCDVNPMYDLGTLYDFVEIDFSGSLNSPNYVDAAIAECSIGDLGKATPGNGYGTPKSTTETASVGLAVQKYGRTTALTKGTVYSIDTTINITYSNGTALFENQIGIFSKKPFIKAGDSGSLLVTTADRNPVGLLFAGNGNGQFAFANPIDDVLKALGVTIDGD